jgi:outer membrane protein assembly factor BamB
LAVQVYLVAEDKIIKVTPPDNWNSARPAWEVIFSYNATAGRSEEIIGFAIHGGHSSLFLTIRNRGLFVLSLRGRLQWSLGPLLTWRGYRFGCKTNVSGCYFDSAPVVGLCEGALYVSLHFTITLLFSSSSFVLGPVVRPNLVHPTTVFLQVSNTEGQLYSLSIESRKYRWVQDLSSLDKVMTIAPGNNRSLYIVFPRKSVVVGLDIYTGNILWQQSIGPLHDQKSLPTVDSNGKE